MKRYLPLSFLAILSLWVAPASVGQSSAAVDEAAIRTLIAQTAEANNAGDVERWVGSFAPGAVYMPPGSPAVTTRAGLVEVAEAGFKHEAAIEIEPAEIRVAGDWAFARSHVTGTVQLAETGEGVAVDVKQIAIYERTEDGWRIARLITNSNS